MKSIPLYSLFLAAVACGPSFQGTVSGYSVNVQDELYVPLTTSAGASTGALLVVSDQPSMCSDLAAPQAPGGASLVMVVLERRANGAPLSPDTGKYTMNADGQNASGAVSSFLVTDANGTQSIPGNNAVATSGLVDVTQYSSTNGMAGTFDGKFGQQGDAVHFQFAAHFCDISTDTLLNGFIGRASEGASLPSGGIQTQACADYVACSTKIGISSTSLSGFAPGGTCWTSSSSTASACDSACRSGNDSFKSSGYESSAGCTFAQ
jgi:hypothetical protein